MSRHISFGRVEGEPIAVNWPGFLTLKWAVNVHALFFGDRSPFVIELRQCAIVQGSQTWQACLLRRCLIVGYNLHCRPLEAPSPFILTIKYTFLCGFPFVKPKAISSAEHGPRTLARSNVNYRININLKALSQPSLSPVTSNHRCLSNIIGAERSFIRQLFLRSAHRAGISAEKVTTAPGQAHQYGLSALVAKKRLVQVALSAGGDRSGCAYCGSTRPCPSSELCGYGSGQRKASERCHEHFESAARYRSGLHIRRPSCGWTDHQIM